MKLAKGMSCMPTSRSDVSSQRTTGWPTSGDAHGHRVFIVLVGVTPYHGGWESQPQGEGRQEMWSSNTKRGMRNAGGQGLLGTRSRTWEKAVTTDSRVSTIIQSGMVPDSLGQNLSK
jgi:hypothetical protein